MYSSNKGTHDAFELLTPTHLHVRVSTICIQTPITSSDTALKVMFTFRPLHDKIEGFTFAPGKDSEQHRHSPVRVIS